MDNRRDLPGYKYYTRADGARPPVYVAFLDLRPGPGRTAGVCFEVDTMALARLDRRERNYDRVDVTDRVELADAPDDPIDHVWAFVGNPEARQRLAAARRDRSAVVQADYLRAVQHAIAAVREAGGDACVPELDGVPVADLIRHELA